MSLMRLGGLLTQVLSEATLFRRIFASFDLVPGKVWMVFRFFFLGFFRLWAFVSGVGGSVSLSCTDFTREDSDTISDFKALISASRSDSSLLCRCTTSNNTPILALCSANTTVQWSPTRWLGFKWWAVGDLCSYKSQPLPAPPQ